MLFESVSVNHGDLTRGDSAVGPATDAGREPTVTYGWKAGVAGALPSAKLTQ